MGLFSSISAPLKRAARPFTTLAAGVPFINPTAISSIPNLNLSGMPTDQLESIQGGLLGRNFFGDILGLGGGSKNAPGPFAGAMPTRPGWDSQIDQQTGLLKAPYQISGNIDTRGIEALRNEALRTGPSAWRTLAEQQDADKLARTQAGYLTQGKNQLATTGGLSSGAAERLASRSNIEGLRQRQALAGQYALADENKRMDTLAQLPGQELNLAQFNRGTQQQNVQNALEDIQGKRQADLASYLEQMRGWASERTAQATPSGGKK
jgi:hypothetical protein